MTDQLVEARQGEPAGAEDPPERALLALAAQLVAVSVVAFPLLGFLTRAIAFRLCDRIGGPGYLHLAAADPLADLIVAGIYAVLWAVPAYIVSIIILGKAVRPNVDGTSRHAHRRRTALIVSVLVAAALAAQVVVTVFGPLTAALASFPPFLILMQWLRAIYRRHGSLRPRWTWPILICLMLVASFSYAMDYSDVPVAEYTMDSASSVPSGWYLELGRGSDTIYLLSCADPAAGVVAVPPALLQRTQYRPAQPTYWGYSLLDLLSGRATPGLQLRCP